jgi:hypothetical protein
MASPKRTLRWRTPDRSRITFHELCRLHLPPGCTVDGLGLDAHGTFAALAVSWAERRDAFRQDVTADVRVDVHACIAHWWREQRVFRGRPLADVIPLRRSGS